jgi:uncharacterized damage-inducible protein DinB
MSSTPKPPLPVEPDRAADEITTLTQFLDYHRSVLMHRAWGLSDAQLSQRLEPSTLTLGGLLKHMALVEDWWFDHRFLGHDEVEPWASAPDDDPDWEFNSARHDTADELFALFTASCDRSRRAIGETPDLDQLSVLTRDDEPWNLRWIMVHMIEEYARHCGHADLIREAIDGEVG